MPSLAVVLVTYNSAPALERSLPALEAELRDGDELIVVDNASRDETVAVVGKLSPTAILVEPRANLGFPAACNLGARRPARSSSASSTRTQWRSRGSGRRSSGRRSMAPAGPHGRASSPRTAATS